MPSVFKAHQRSNFTTWSCSLHSSSFWMVWYYSRKNDLVKITAFQGGVLILHAICGQIRIQCPLCIPRFPALGHLICTLRYTCTHPNNRYPTKCTTPRICWTRPMNFTYQSGNNSLILSTPERYSREEERQCTSIQKEIRKIEYRLALNFFVVLAKGITTSHSSWKKHTQA
jgi:hypothetical protein